MVSRIHFNHRGLRFSYSVSKFVLFFNQFEKGLNENLIADNTSYSVHISLRPRQIATRKAKRQRRNLETDSHNETTGSIMGWIAHGVLTNRDTQLVAQSNRRPLWSKFRFRRFLTELSFDSRQTILFLAFADSFLKFISSKEFPSFSFLMSF